MNRSLLTALLLVLAATTSGQWDTISYSTRDTARVMYDETFTFREGVYFGFEDFQVDRPSVPLAALKDDQGRPAGDLRQSDGRLNYTDGTGTSRPLDLRRIWGFCVRGVVYVRIGDGFSRIGLMGSLAHVVFDNTYRNWGYYDPMYGMGPTTITVQEQRLLDMGTGEFLPVNASGIQRGIRRDPELLAEFEALPKRERNREEVVYRFMIRYNQRNPLFFPK